jgi:hypothetical protein
MMFNSNNTAILNLTLTTLRSFLLASLKIDYCKQAVLNLMLCITNKNIANLYTFTVPLLVLILLLSKNWHFFCYQYSGTGLTLVGHKKLSFKFCVKRWLIPINTTNSQYVKKYRNCFCYRSKLTTILLLQWGVKPETNQNFVVFMCALYHLPPNRFKHSSHWRKYPLKLSIHLCISCLFVLSLLMHLLLPQNWQCISFKNEPHNDDLLTFNIVSFDYRQYIDFIYKDKMFI